MTPQEVFDTVVAHLRQQNSQALLGDEQAPHLAHLGLTGCAYKAKDGRKCAAGCLFQENEYNLNMEGHNLRSILANGNFASSLRERLEPHLNLIEYLQHIHDYAPVDTWEQNFQYAAEEHRLTYTSPATGDTNHG